MSRLLSPASLVLRAASQALTTKTLAHSEPEIVVYELNGSIEPICRFVAELISPSQLRAVEPYRGEGKNVEVEAPHTSLVFDVTYYMLFEWVIPITRLFYGVKATIATGRQGLTSWHVGDVIHD